MTITCSLLEPADRARRFLRRYAGGKPCSGEYGYHNVSIFLDESEFVGEEGLIPTDEQKIDLPWPPVCVCNYRFEPEDSWQINLERLWVRTSTQELLILRDCKPGDMWDAYWWHERPMFCGPDGKAIEVVCPDGRQWSIDGKANNCDSPCAFCGVAYNNHRDRHSEGSQVNSCESYKDSRPDHKCWVRHGIPPVLTVDKAGPTCGAGAGSIDTGGYHGFLRNGVFS